MIPVPPPIANGDAEEAASEAWVESEDALTHKAAAIGARARYICGGPGSGIPGPCPEGKDDKEGGDSGPPAGSDTLHAKAEAKSKTLVERAKELPGKVYAAAKEKIQAKYEKLKDRYGKAAALGIMAGGLLGTAIPLPGATLAVVAPLIGVAELYRALKGATVKAAKAQKQADEYTDEELETLGKEWLDELLADWQENDLPGLTEE